MDIVLFEFDFVQMAVAISAIVIAYTLNGFSGFGAGLIAIPILSLVFHVTIVVPVVSLLSFSANLTQSFKLMYYT
ncbi:MAG: putative membrane protein YfcA [Chitinophagales bacterium]